MLCLGRRCGFALGGLGEVPNMEVQILHFMSFCSAHCLVVVIRLPNIVEYIQQPLQAGLTDKSAYVRRTAVMGVVKMFYVAPDLISGRMW